jgi:GT2 family glycosyltransferase
MAVRRSLEGGADYILVINNDIIVTPSIIKELKAALDADGSIGAVSPIMAYYDRPGVFQFTGCSIDWGNGELLRRYSEEDLKRREVLDTDVISWGGALIRKEAIDAAGYLDERFFMYYDDTDWSTRCRRAGFKTLLYTKPLIYHKGSRSSGGSFSPLFYFYYTRNKVLFFRKQARALRKLQFGFNYVKHARNNYLRLSRNGEAEAAAAALDGLWSGVKGCLYEERLEMPGCIRGKLNLIDRTYLRLLTLRAVFA